ncbi:SpoIIE family protein phosphatase [uncultured Pseudokineococcus sp.]|uniref:SpoIIE family protein phosphatase n=1 Tax=uncultured Pseudokineococcus sp. TaxID=1642928 RepID=UPI002605E198|nr:SpoIIE family protein phosphatase [uncultured Pseudokineococcus sp.]
MTEIDGLADVQPLAGAVLPSVVRDTPAAVLLVDLQLGEVVYANHLAQQLAPGTGLPVSIPEWSRAAGLHDDTGEDLEDGPAPLRRVASGEPVTGEAVTAARESDTTSAREALWVVGIPLTDAPPPLATQALVVMLPLREQEAVAELQESGDLRHRAVLASDLSFSISDPHTEDNPLVWVNPAFERTTGYSFEDVAGRNCRFLQGPGTDPEAVARISRALREDEPVTEVLLNFRKDGTAFWNEVVISPVFDAEGQLTHHVGVQADVTARVEAAAERDRALEAARLANARLEALARVSTALSSRLDSREALAVLPGLVVPDLAVWAFALGTDGSGRASSFSVVHRDPAMAEHARALAAEDPSGYEHGPVLVELLSGAVTTPLSWELGAEEVAATLTSEASRAAVRAMGVGRVVVVPLRARGRTTAVLGLVLGDAPPPSATDVATMADVGLRAGLAIDNARLYEREHAAALTLQRSLLPDLPDLEHFDVAATYLPASLGAEVGGDWYDVLDLPDGAVGVAIGDVMGHDLSAAAAMGQLRSVLRSYAWSGDEPGAVLRQLDLLVRGLGMAGLATCVYARIACDADGARCAVTYAKAGHPPPLLLLPDGRVERLDQALTTPIGVAAAKTVVDQAEVPLPPGASLVLYTDGLVERRDRPLRQGIEELAQTLAAAPAGCDATTLRDLVVERFADGGEDLDDDTCVLVVRRSPDAPA